MEINNKFINASETIRERIENMTAYNCITDYFEYIYGPKGEGFEQEYIKKLNTRSKKFITDLYCKRYESSSKEELLEILKELYWDGSYALSEEATEDIIYSFEGQFKDAEAYPYIKKEMLNALNELIEDINRTKKEEEIKKAKSRVTELEKNIERYTKQVKEATESLTKAKEILADLTKTDESTEEACKVGVRYPVEAAADQRFR